MDESDHTHSKPIRRLKVGPATPSVLDLLIVGAGLILALFGIGFFAGRGVGGIGRLALLGIGLFAGRRAGGIGRHFEVLLTILPCC